MPPTQVPSSIPKTIPLRHKSIDDIKDACEIAEDGNRTAARMCRITGEFEQGFDSIKKYQKSVTFFGGARFKEGDFYFEKAQHLAERIVKETGFAIITGGGPGIMEAGNKGAYIAGGKSVGVTIELPTEQGTNPYVTEDIPFNFFFTRKTILTYAAEMYVAFPGGYGTLDELFEILTLMETKKVPIVPVYLYGSEFWQPLASYFKAEPLAHDAITSADIELFRITDDDDEIIKKLKDIHIIKGY